MMNLTVLIYIIIGLLLVNCDTISDDVLAGYLGGSKKELFKAYHNIFDKKYSLNSVEAINRFEIFKSNLNFIEKHNMNNDEFKMKIGSYTDMSKKEFKNKILMKENIINQFISELKNKKYLAFDLNNNSFNTISNSELKINWKDKFGPILHQRYCGSCWAFSTISVIEANYNIKYNKPISLSVQQLISCDNNNKACSGGWPNSALDYIINNGIERLEFQSYDSGFNHSRNICKKSGKELKLVEGYETCPWGSCDLNKIKAILSKGPIISLIDATSEEFRNYGSGIMSLNNCKVLNHAIVIVGLDRDESGEYFIGRNSWGDSWGEKGYFRIRVNENSNTCFMTAGAWRPIVNEKQIELKCSILYSSRDFKGKEYNICESNERIDNLLLAKDLSLKLNSLKKITFFKEYNCNGKSFSILKTTNSFENLNDTEFLNWPKSYSVITENPPSNCFWAFHNPCYKSFKHEICGSITNLKSLGLDDDFHSILLGDNIEKIELFSEKYFKSNSIVINTKSLSINGMNLKIFQHVYSLKIHYKS